MAGLLTLFLTFALATPDTFLTNRSLSSILNSQAVPGIVAIGITLLMISGEFDLSVGSILGVSSLVFLYTAVQGLHILLAALLGLLTGCLLGFLNGLLLVWAGIPSFIVTFGTMLVYRGISLTAISGGRIIRYADHSRQPPLIHLPPLLIAAAAAGVYPPTRGEIRFLDRSVHLASPQDARALGIETVYQDLALIPRMSISRNFYLGREQVQKVDPFRFLDRETMNARSTNALRAIGIHIRNPDEPVGSLSGGERQSIAIGRAIHFGSRLLILDEPTSALSVGETRKVLGYITAAKEKGLSVIFITHNIHHVFEVADRLTVLSHGEKVGDFARDEVSSEEVAQMVMGEGVPERLQENGKR